MQYKSEKTDNSNLDLQNKQVQEIINEVNAFIKKRRESPKVTFVKEDIFNPNKPYYTPYNLPVKIELLRRITSVPEQNKFLLKSEEYSYYLELVSLIKEHEYFKESQKWISGTSSERVKYWIVHAFLVDAITEDEMVDSISAMDIDFDVKQDGHIKRVFSILDEQDNPVSELEALMLGFQLTEHEKQKFITSLKELKNQGSSLCSWAVSIISVDLKYVANFAESLLNVLKTTRSKYLFNKNEFIILNSAVYKALLIAQWGKNAVLPRSVLGPSNELSIGRGLKELRRDHWMPLEKNKLPQMIHGFEIISFHIVHDMFFHSMKCTSIPRNLRDSFLHISDLLLKMISVLKDLDEPESSISLGSLSSFYQWDSIWIEVIPYRYIDQDFSGKFMRGSSDSKQALNDYFSLINALKEEAFNIILLDVVLNEGYWKQHFNLGIDEFILNTVNRKHLMSVEAKIELIKKEGLEEIFKGSKTDLSNFSHYNFLLFKDTKDQRKPYPPSFVGTVLEGPR